MPPRLRPVAVFALAVAVGVFVALTSAHHGFFDLRVYSGAVTQWVDGGNLYSYERGTTGYGFTYPPFAALLMLPMAVVSWPVAIVISVLAAVVSTGLVVWWLVDPVARRAGWPRIFSYAVALCVVAALEPVRETVTFGQVNTLLLAMVAADLLWLVGRDSRWGGVGIGLATAVKLTPGIFVLYLLVTRRWRAAAVATGTWAAATLLAAAVAPGASREFWTRALWDTDRVGSLSYVSNQSLSGMLARLSGADRPNTAAWLVLVVMVLAVWGWRVHGAREDVLAGLALTGVAGCLVSPVTWVHHLVWLLPALILLVDRAIAEPDGSRRRWALLCLAAFSVALLSSRIVWIWRDGASGVTGLLWASAYVWLSLILLLALPVRRGVREVESTGANV